nr:helix-turn-helix domain-containing protein [Nocardioides sp. zg-DK7169]
MAEQGVSLAGSELLRQQSVREAEERARNDFVHALLHNRFTDQFELAARAEHYRFPLDGRFAVLIVSSPDVRPDDAMGRQRAVDVARAARRDGTTPGSLALSALIGSMIVVVKQVPAARRDDPEQETVALRSFADQVLKLASRRLGDGVRVTFGRAAEGASGVAQSYREARTAEALARRVGTSAVTTYQDLRVFAALQDAAASRAGIEFAREILAPLQDSDGQTGNLEAVALAYIAESGNLNATARRLHLHRNTMLYKLERTSRALHMDIRTSEAQFMVWLAHHLLALREVTAQLDDELAPPH